MDKRLHSMIQKNKEFSLIVQNPITFDCSWEKNSSKYLVGMEKDVIFASHTDHWWHKHGYILDLHYPNQYPHEHEPGCPELRPSCLG